MIRRLTKSIINECKHHEVKSNFVSLQSKKNIGTFQY